MQNPLGLMIHFRGVCSPDKLSINYIAKTNPRAVLPECFCHPLRSAAPGHLIALSCLIRSFLHFLARVQYLYCQHLGVSLCGLSCDATLVLTAAFNKAHTHTHTHTQPHTQAHRVIITRSVGCSLCQRSLASG